ncbi:MAG: excinuclease ABC subunit UvrC [Chloroflexia bacterium]
MAAPTELEERLRALPEHPGVYLFRDAAGKVLYVGKSVNLRERVRSYFGAPAGLAPKTRELVARIADFEVLLTDGELEALILENNLIKEHRPRYNIRLRDDKGYPFIKVTTNEEWPRVLKTRRLENDGARYFGPFSSAGSVDRTLRLLKKLFPYRGCEEKIDGRRKRPCLDYYIGRCLAPCVGYADPQEYARAIREVILFLEGRGEQIVRMVREEMEKAAEALNFERAAALRDQLQDLERVLEHQKVVSPRMEDEDVIALARDEGETCVQVFFIRRGRLIGNEPFFLQGTEEEDPIQVMTAFVAQFYGRAPQIPSVLLLQHPVAEPKVLAEWLRQKRGGTVRLLVPRRGEKRRLVEMVARNAVETLEQMRLKWLSERQRQAGALAELREVLGLPSLPRRIEGYDVSTLQGQAAVGSMVVFVDGAPRRSDYRRFRIRTVEGQDDPAMLGEVLRRRFRRAGAEGKEGEGWGELPDLILVDGGPGQVGAAQEVLNEAGLEVPLLGLAKKEEAVYRPGRPEPLLLPRNSVTLYLLQRLRDEAHRFALTYHRRERQKQGLHSTLEDLPGIGPRRQAALLKRFGSLAAIRAASEEELAAVPGIGRALARTLKERLG